MQVFSPSQVSGTLTYNANTNPGLLDGIVPQCSFPDGYGQNTVDARLLHNYYVRNSGVAWTQEEMRAVSGYGTFGLVEPATRAEHLDPRLFIEHAHNDYLEALAEGGLVRLALTVALLAATTFMMPVSNDAGTYLTVADAILAGKLPYRDIFDHKTPGIYAVFAAVLAATQRSPGPPPSASIAATTKPPTTSTPKAPVSSAR